jgi:flagellar biogenesis protein FliO
MPLIQLLEVLIVVGVLLWLVNRFIPMQSNIKSILKRRGSHCRGSVAA